MGVGWNKNCRLWGEFQHQVVFFPRDGNPALNLLSYSDLTAFLLCIPFPLPPDCGLFLATYSLPTCYDNISTMVYKQPWSLSGSPSSSFFSEMPGNELHCSLQRTTRSEKHAFLKSCFFSLSHLFLGEDLMTPYRQAISGNPLYCLYDRRFICRWWHPCWLPESMSIMLDSCLPSITTFFFLEKTWHNCDWKWWYLFISSSLMCAIGSQICLTIRITVMGEEWRFLGSSSGDTDRKFRSEVFPETTI